MFKLRTCTALAMGILSASVMASPGPYVGLSLDHSSLNYTGSNQNLSPASKDNSGLAWNAFAGYQFMENFGLQMDFNDYHDASLNNVRGLRRADVDYDQKSLDVVGKFILPLTYGFNLFATGGLAYVDLNRDANSVAERNGIVLSDETMIRPTYGLGAAYAFNSHWAAQLAWSQIVSGGVVQRSNLWGLGVSYSFGGDSDTDMMTSNTAPATATSDMTLDS